MGYQLKTLASNIFFLEFQQEWLLLPILKTNNWRYLFTISILDPHLICGVAPKITVVVSKQEIALLIVVGQGCVQLTYKEYTQYLYLLYYYIYIYASAFYTCTYMVTYNAWIQSYYYSTAKILYKPEKTEIKMSIYITFLLKNLCQVACLHEEILFKKAYIPSMYLMQIVGI